MVRAQARTVGEQSTDVALIRGNDHDSKTSNCLVHMVQFNALSSTDNGDKNGTGKSAAAQNLIRSGAKSPSPDQQNKFAIVDVQNQNHCGRLGRRLKFRTGLYKHRMEHL